MIFLGWEQLKSSLGLGVASGAGGTGAAEHQRVKPSTHPVPGTFSPLEEHQPRNI